MANQWKRIQNAVQAVQAINSIQLTLHWPKETKHNWMSWTILRIRVIVFAILKVGIKFRKFFIIIFIRWQLNWFALCQFAQKSRTLHWLQRTVGSKNLAMHLSRKLFQARSTFWQRFLAKSIWQQWDVSWKASVLSFDIWASFSYHSFNCCLQL